MKRPFRPTAERDGTPDPKRLKPNFEKRDGTLNVTKIPPLEWDVTSEKSDDGRRAERKRSGSPPPNRKRQGSRDRGKKGKGDKGRGAKGKGKGRGKQGSKGKRSPSRPG